MAMTIDQLVSEIEAYPQRLHEALEAVEKAEKAIEKLNEQIEEEEANLSPGEDTPSTDSDTQETLLRLDHELALLELRYEQIKGEIELDYRRNPPPGDKVTEATVTAFVKSHPRLVEAKERCLEKKFARETANGSRRVGYATRRAETREPVTSPKLEKLRERLLTAEMRLEEVKARLHSYQMLTQLYAARMQS